MTSLEDLTSELFGPKGSLKRTKYERDANRRAIKSNAVDLIFKPLCLFPIGGKVAYVFWSTLFDGGIKQIPDALSFTFLGDVLFWKRPIAEKTPIISGPNLRETLDSEKYFTLNLIKEYRSYKKNSTLLRWQLHWETNHSRTTINRGI